MLESSGYLAGQKKWLVLRYPLPPGKLLFLGSILTDPEDPETSLNWQTGPVPVPERLKLDGSMAIRQQIHSELSTNASALLKVVPPSSPLFNAGVKVEGKSSDEVKTTVETMDVKATFFIPDKTYMDAALAKDEIIKSARKCHFSKSMYMVVGVATAGQIIMTEDQSRERSLAASANASLTGSSAEFEAELSHGTTAKTGGTLKVGEPCDFAYRVRGFKYSRLFGKFNDRGDLITTLRDMPVFARGRSGYERNEVDDFVPRFDSWGEEDIGIPGTFTLVT